MIRMSGLIKLFVTMNLVAACLVTTPRDAVSQGRRLIHDTEIETTIRTFATPLFTAAGISPDAIRIHIIQDDTLNAFVAGGQNLFLHTGFLMRTENPLQMIGVMAHETGHIAGGHLARTSDAIRNASNAALLGLVLGAVTAVATGRGDAAVAVFQGATSLSRSSLLEYSRSQESAADHAGLRYLDATGQSSRGLVEFLGMLSGEELLVRARRSPYVNTHPLTQDRIAFVENHLANTKYADVQPPPRFVEMHARMVAKLTGFIRTPARTFRKYPDEDTSVAARYARVIATFKEPAPDRALTLLDTLLRDFPEDGYFWELRGQILFESGRPEKARVAYRKALTLLTDAPLIEGNLARVELAINTPSSNQAALKLLGRTIRALPDSAFAWHQLAIAQGRTGDLAMAALSLAEEALLRNRTKDAALQAKRAQQKLKRGSPGWQRAVDIEQLAKRRLRER